MTTFKISMVLLIVIILSSVVYIYALNNTTDRFVSEIDDLERSVESEKWLDAEKQLDEVQEKWAKTEKWLATLIDHEEIDNIKLTLARLSQYVHGKEKTDFMAESASLRLLIKHIPGKEKVNFSNLF